MTQANLDWINLYRAALKECDAEKRLVKIEEAQRAMKEALRLAVEHGRERLPVTGPFSLLHQKRALT